MRYCLARYRERETGRAYQIYVTDALRIIAENTAKYAGGGYIKARYADIIDPKPQDNRSCEEITADVIARCGLVVE